MVFGSIVLLLGGVFLAYVALPLISARGHAHPKRAAVCCTDPSDLGFEYEDVSFNTVDNLLLKGWYLPSSNGAVIILAHGIAGNRVSQLPQAQVLVNAGYGVILFDARAHGESQGDTITLDGRDVLAVVDYLQAQPGIEHIGAFGVSLGAMVVIQAAADSPAIEATMVEGPGFTSPDDFASIASLDDLLWRPFDLVWLEGLKREGVHTGQPTTDALGAISPRSVMLVSGAGSRFERRAMRHYHSTAGSHVSLWEIPEAQHAGGWGAKPTEYVEKLVAFFDDALLAD